MSDPTPASAAAPEPSKPQINVRKAKKKRTWKQRFKILAILVLILAFGARLGLNFLLPVVVRRVANAYELDCGYSRMDLTLFGGTAHIWGLELRPKAGGASIAKADYVQGVISPLNLLRGRLVVWRAEVDGVDVLFDREADGSIPLLKQFLSGSPPPPQIVNSSTSTSTQTRSLEAPLRVSAIRVTHVNAKFRDRSVSPPFETTVRTNLRVSDIGSDVVPTEFELDVEADPVLDSLHIRGETRNTPTNLQTDLQVLLRGIHLKPAASYLAMLGLKPVAEGMTIRATASLKADVIPNSSDISASLALDHIEVVTDNQQWASLETLTLDAKKLNPTTAEFGTLTIKNATAAAQRTREGRLRVAGVEIVPAVAASAKVPPEAREVPAPSTAPAGPPNFHIAIDEIALSNLEARFADERVSPPAKLVARLDDLHITEVLPAVIPPDWKSTLKGAVSVPGVIRSVQFSGVAAPFADQKRFQTKIIAEGVKPDAIKPYLQQIGLESSLEDGKFTADVDATLSMTETGTIRANASATNVAFDDGQSQLIALSGAKMTGLEVDPNLSKIRIASIEVSGPTLPLRRDQSGNIAVLGLRTVAAAPAEIVQTADNAPTTSVATAPPVIPIIQIDQFVWKDIQMQFDDAAKGKTASISLGQAGVEMKNLLIDLQSKGANPNPGTFRAWFSSPKLVDQFSIEGTLNPMPRGFAVESKVSATGITGEAVAGYLENLNVVPLLKSGQLNLQSKMTVSRADDGTLNASFDLNDLRYADGEKEIAGVDSVHLDGFAMKPGEIAVDGILVDRPRADVTRNADGSFEVAGVRLVPATRPAVAGSTAPSISEFPTLHLPPAPIAAILKQLQVQDAEIHWTDRSVTPPVTTSVRGSVKLADAQVSSSAKPASLIVDGKVDGAVEHATITGTLILAPDKPAAELQVVADGVTAKSLEPYFPPGMSSTLNNGHFTVSLFANASNHPDGGIAARVGVRDLLLEDRASSQTWAKVPAFAFSSRRFDPAGGVIAIDEVSSSGIEANLNKLPDGSLEAAGFRLAAVAAPTSRPQTNSTDSAATSQPAADVATLVTAARKPLPLVTVNKLDLNLDRVRISGATGPDATPITLAAVHLYNTGPIEIAGPDAENRPPVKLRIDGGIAPVVTLFTVNIESLPLATEPKLSLDISASGIKGAGLTQVAPALATTVDGSQLTEGSFRTHLDASFNYGRRGPRDLDLSRGFSLELDVRPLEYRAVPDGPVLAGLEEIRTEGVRVEPKTGNVSIKSIELTKPIGRFSRDEQGLHAMGVLIPLKLPTTQQAGGSPSASDGPVASKQGEPLVRPSNEIRLDHLLVSGIDVIVEDHTSSPPTVIPLKTLDVDVRDLSNQMPWTGKPARFDMLVTADKVPLPPRKGISGEASTQPSSDGQPMEMRELFSQVSVTGIVAVKAVDNQLVLDGWAKTSVNGFELLGVRELAKQQGLTIHGGVMDDSNELRFRPDGPIDTRNKIVFTNLSLSEPANGPLQTLLKIPAPIDVAIGAVTDPDGSITLNVDFPVKNGSVGMSDVAVPAGLAVGQVLTTAILSSPIKVAGGVGDLLGMGGKAGQKPEPPVVVAFLPGYSAVDGEQIKQIASLAQRMQKDRNLELQLHHTLTAGDVEHSGVRANPSLDDCRVMVEQLRRQRMDLSARRATLSAQVHGEIASQVNNPASLQSLRELDRQIAQAEDSLDELCDLLRPGAANQSERRTRAASLSVGRARLAMVKSSILNDILSQRSPSGASTGSPDSAYSQLEQRIHVTNPQYDPSNSQDGGAVVVTLVPKKH